MKKNIGIILFSVLLGLFLIGCGANQAQPSEQLTGSEQPAESENEKAPEQSANEEQLSEPVIESVSGGWEMPALTAVELPEDVKAGFVKIAEGKNKDLVPVALVGQQVVAGTNDMILCVRDKGYEMAVIYRDLQGNAELTQSSPFDLADYVEGGDASPAELLSGGWNAPEILTSLPLPEDAQTAFDKAEKDFDGSQIEPMALLGTQVVAGTNYAILCRVTPMTPDAISSTQVVIVYADLEGKAEFTGFSALDCAKYNQ